MMDIDDTQTVRCTMSNSGDVRRSVKEANSVGTVLSKWFPAKYRYLISESRPSSDGMLP